MLVFQVMQFCISAGKLNSFEAGVLQYFHFMLY